MKLTLAASKPRNPVAPLARRRRAGAHQPSAKAQRHAARQACRLAVREAAAHAPHRDL